MKTKFIILLLLPFTILSQDPSKHIPWKLDGADERIEQNRKGNVLLEFILKDKIDKRSNSNIDLESNYQ